MKCDQWLVAIVKKKNTGTVSFLEVSSNMEAPLMTADMTGRLPYNPTLWHKGLLLPFVPSAWLSPNTVQRKTTWLHGWPFPLRAVLFLLEAGGLGSNHCFAPEALNQRVASFPQLYRQIPQWWRCRTRQVSTPLETFLASCSQHSCLLCSSLSLWCYSLLWIWCLVLLRHTCENISSS